MNNGNNNQLNQNIGFGTYSPIFGNLLFQNGAQQPLPQPVQPDFGQIPYMSVTEVSQGLAALAPAETATTTSGSTQGNINVSGTLTATDSSGNTRVQLGYSKGAF